MYTHSNLHTDVHPNITNYTANVSLDQNSRSILLSDISSNTSNPLTSSNESNSTSDMYSNASNHRADLITNTSNQYVDISSNIRHTNASHANSDNNTVSDVYSSNKSSNANPKISSITNASSNKSESRSDLPINSSNVIANASSISDAPSNTSISGSNLPRNLSNDNAGVPSNTNNTFLNSSSGKDNFLSDLHTNSSSAYVNASSNSNNSHVHPLTNTNNSRSELQTNSSYTFSNTSNSVSDAQSSNNNSRSHLPANTSDDHTDISSNKSSLVLHVPSGTNNSRADVPTNVLSKTNNSHADVSTNLGLKSNTNNSDLNALSRLNNSHPGLSSIIRNAYADVFLNTINSILDTPSNVVNFHSDLPSNTINSLMDVSSNRNIDLSDSKINNYISDIHRNESNHSDEIISNGDISHLNLLSNKSVSHLDISSNTTNSHLHLNTSKSNSVPFYLNISSNANNTFLHVPSDGNDLHSNISSNASNIHSNISSNANNSFVRVPSNGNDLYSNISSNASNIHSNLSSNANNSFVRVPSNGNDLYSNISSNASNIHSNISSNASNSTNISSNASITSDTSNSKDVFSNVSNSQSNASSNTGSPHSDIRSNITISASELPSKTNSSSSELASTRNSSLLVAHSNGSDFLANISTNIANAHLDVPSNTSNAYTNVTSTKSISHSNISTNRYNSSSDISSNNSVNLPINNQNITASHDDNRSNALLNKTTLALNHSNSSEYNINNNNSTNTTEMYFFAYDNGKLRKIFKSIVYPISLNKTGSTKRLKFFSSPYSPNNRVLPRRKYKMYSADIKPEVLDQFSQKVLDAQKRRVINPPEGLRRSGIQHTAFRLLNVEPSAEMEGNITRKFVFSYPESSTKVPLHFTAMSNNKMKLNLRSTTQMKENANKRFNFFTYNNSTNRLTKLFTVMHAADMHYNNLSFPESITNNSSTSSRSDLLRYTTKDLSKTKSPRFQNIASSNNMLRNKTDAKISTHKRRFLMPLQKTKVENENKTQFYLYGYNNGDKILIKMLKTVLGRNSKELGIPVTNTSKKSVTEPLNSRPIKNVSWSQLFHKEPSKYVKKNNTLQTSKNIRSDYSTDVHQDLSRQLLKLQSSANIDENNTKRFNFYTYDNVSNKLTKLFTIIHQRNSNNGNSSKFKVLPSNLSKAFSMLQPKTTGNGSKKLTKPVPDTNSYNKKLIKSSIADKTLKLLHNAHSNSIGDVFIENYMRNNPVEQRYKLYSSNHHSFLQIADNPLQHKIITKRSYTPLNSDERENGLFNMRIKADNQPIIPLQLNERSTISSNIPLRFAERSNIAKRWNIPLNSDERENGLFNMRIKADNQPIIPLQLNERSTISSNIPLRFAERSNIAKRWDIPLNSDERENGLFNMRIKADNQPIIPLQLNERSTISSNIPLRFAERSNIAKRWDIPLNSDERENGLFNMRIKADNQPIIPLQLNERSTISSNIPLRFAERSNIAKQWNIPLNSDERKNGQVNMRIKADNQPIIPLQLNERSTISSNIPLRFAERSNSAKQWNIPLNSDENISKSTNTDQLSFIPINIKAMPDDKLPRVTERKQSDVNYYNFYIYNSLANKLIKLFTIQPKTKEHIDDALDSRKTENMHVNTRSSLLSKSTKTPPANIYINGSLPLHFQTNTTSYLLNVDYTYNSVNNELTNLFMSIAESDVQNHSSKGISRSAVPKNSSRILPKKNYVKGNLTLHTGVRSTNVNVLGKAKFTMTRKNASMKRKADKKKLFYFYSYSNIDKKLVKMFKSLAVSNINNERSTKNIGMKRNIITSKPSNFIIIIQDKQHINEKSRKTLHMRKRNIIDEMTKIIPNYKSKTTTYKELLPNVEISPTLKREKVNVDTYKNIGNKLKAREYTSSYVKRRSEVSILSPKTKYIYGSLPLYFHSNTTSHNLKVTHNVVDNKLAKHFIVPEAEIRYTKGNPKVSLKLEKGSLDYSRAGIPLNPNKISTNINLTKDENNVTSYDREVNNNDVELYHNNTRFPMYQSNESVGINGDNNTQKEISNISKLVPAATPYIPRWTQSAETGIETDSSINTSLTPPTDRWTNTTTYQRKYKMHSSNVDAFLGKLDSLLDVRLEKQIPRVIEKRSYIPSDHISLSNKKLQHFHKLKSYLNNAKQFNIYSHKNVVDKLTERVSRIHAEKISSNSRDEENNVLSSTNNIINNSNIEVPSNTNTSRSDQSSNTYNSNSGQSSNQSNAPSDVSRIAKMKRKRRKIRYLFSYVYNKETKKWVKRGRSIPNKDVKNTGSPFHGYKLLSSDVNSNSVNKSSHEAKTFKHMYGNDANSFNVYEQNNPCKQYIKLINVIYEPNCHHIKSKAVSYASIQTTNPKQMTNYNKSLIMPLVNNITNSSGNLLSDRNDPNMKSNVETNTSVLPINHQQMTNYNRSFLMSQMNKIPNSSFKMNMSNISMLTVSNNTVLPIFSLNIYSSKDRKLFLSLIDRSLHNNLTSPGSVKRTLVEVQSHTRPSVVHKEMALLGLLHARHTRRRKKGVERLFHFATYHNATDKPKKLFPIIPDPESNIIKLRRLLITSRLSQMRSDVKTKKLNGNAKTEGTLREQYKERLQLPDRDVTLKARIRHRYKQISEAYGSPNIDALTAAEIHKMKNTVEKRNKILNHIQNKELSSKSGFTANPLDKMKTNNIKRPIERYNPSYHKHIITNHSQLLPLANEMSHLISKTQSSLMKPTHTSIEKKHIAVVSNNTVFQKSPSISKAVDHKNSSIKNDMNSNGISKQKMKIAKETRHLQQNNETAAYYPKKKFGINRYIDLTHYLGIHGQFIPNNKYQADNNLANTIDELSGKRWDKTVLHAIDESTDTEAGPEDGITTIFNSNDYLTPRQNHAEIKGNPKDDITTIYNSNGYLTPRQNHAEIKGNPKDDITTIYNSNGYLRPQPNHGDVSGSPKISINTMYNNNAYLKSQGHHGDVTGSLKDVIIGGKYNHDLLRGEPTKEDTGVTKSCIDEGRFYTSPFCGEQIIDHGIVGRPGMERLLPGYNGNDEQVSTMDIVPSRVDNGDTGFDRISSEQKEHPIGYKLKGNTAHVEVPSELLVSRYDQENQVNVDNDDNSNYYNDGHKFYNNISDFKAKKESAIAEETEEIGSLKDDENIQKVKVDESLVSKIKMDKNLENYIDNLQKTDLKTMSQINELTQPSDIPLPSHEGENENGFSNLKTERNNEPPPQVTNHIQEISHSPEMEYATKENMVEGEKRDGKNSGISSKSIEDADETHAESSCVHCDTPSSVYETHGNERLQQNTMEHKVADFSQSIGHPLFMETHEIAIRHTGSDLAPESLVDPHHHIEADVRVFNNADVNTFSAVDKINEIAHPLNAVGTAMGSPSIPTYNLGGSQGM